MCQFCSQTVKKSLKPIVLSTCAYSVSGFELYSTYSVTGNNQALLESAAVTVTMTFFASFFFEKT
jgi:hypothetical protein